MDTDELGKEVYSYCQLILYPRYMHVFFACLYGVTLITFWFVPESVKWLSTRKGRKNRKRMLKVLGKLFFKRFFMSELVDFLWITVP